MKLIILLIVPFMMVMNSCASDNKAEKINNEKDEIVVDNNQRNSLATKIFQEINLELESETFLQEAKASIDPIVLEDNIPDINLYLQGPKSKAMQKAQMMIEQKLKEDQSIFKNFEELMKYLGENKYYPFDPQDKSRLEGMNNSEKNLAAEMIKFDLIPMETSQSIFQEQFTSQQLADIDRMAPEQNMFNMMINDYSDLLMIAEEK